MRGIIIFTPLFLPFVLSLSKHRSSFPPSRKERTALRQAQGERSISAACLPALALVVSTLLAGCERPAPDTKGVDAGNPLEIAARERGVVRAEAASPVGVFERRHDLGRDAMCVVADGAGTWRFARSEEHTSELQYIMRSS